tara:strand:- start:426 stop:1463 length:1038 start_codon:yes stop_codon:yes gene_type:complete
MKKLLLLLVGLSLSGCAALSGTPQPAAAPKEAPLGWVGQTPIYRSDLPEDIRGDLNTQENEHEQRRLHLLWLGLEDRFAEQLLYEEAVRRGQTVDELKKDEIEAKIKEPQEAEIKAIYEANKSAIGVPYEQIGAFIKSQMLAERQKLQEQAFVEALKETAQVRYTLPVPDLPRMRIDVGDAPYQGAEEPLVTLVEYSDFQCPYCAQATEVVKQLLDIYPNVLKVVFKDYPLPQHAQAYDASVAAHCANEQDKFWPYHDLLFKNPQALAATDLKKYAKDIGLDEKGFDKCLSSGHTKAIVDGHRREGELLGVQGTPALFINGMKLIGLLPMPLLRAIIDRELAEAS